MASWEEYGRGATDASVRHLPGVTGAIFPREPERAVYNNALLDRGLEAHARARAVDAMEAMYANGAVTHFAAWIHESDLAMRADVERRGYTLDTTTRAMAADLDDVELPPDVDIAPVDWSDYLRYEALPADFLKGADHAALHVLAAREEGSIVAAALAYDHDDDCGVYNVGTVERARRRGMGSAVTLAQLHAARIRGRHTASLQATPMAERFYARLGFVDLGRILEYVPGPAAPAATRSNPGC